MKRIKNKVARWFIDSVFALNHLAAEVFLFFRLEFTIVFLKCRYFLRYLYHAVRIFLLQRKNLQLKRDLLILRAKEVQQTLCSERSEYRASGDSNCDVVDGHRQPQIVVFGLPNSRIEQRAA